MSQAILGYAFVGIWRTTLSEIPVLSEDFRVGLFDDPRQTRMAITEDGLTIGRADDAASPNVLVNTMRFQVRSDSPESVGRISAALLAKLREVTATDLALSIVGFNVEYEWSGIGKRADAWLGERFLGHAFEADAQEGGVYIMAGHIEFLLGLKATGTFYSVLLQPREGISDAVYGRINDTRPWDTSWAPDEATITRLFQTSLDESRVNLFPMLRFPS